MTARPSPARDAETLRDGLQELLDSGDFNFLVRPYSGRGMHRAECLAIVADVLDLFEIGYALARTDAFEHVLRPPIPRTDAMGRDMVVYWPDVTIEATS
jgi:hypothetical protein